jgi:hypothetical protein
MRQTLRETRRGFINALLAIVAILPFFGPPDFVRKKSSRIINLKN